MLVTVDFSLAAVLQHHLRRRSATAVPEVYGGAPSAPAGAEEQRVHDGTGHVLDDTRRASLRPHRATRTRSLSGCGAAAIRGGWGNRQRVHFLGQVVVTVRQLGEGLKVVLIDRTGMAWFRRGSLGGWMVWGAGAVP